MVQIRLKAFLILVPVLGLLLATAIWIFTLCKSLQEFYGPMGTLERKALIADSSVAEKAGDDLLAAGRTREAEEAYRRAINYSRPAAGNDAETRDLRLNLELARSLVLQGRNHEAEELYQRSQEIYRGLDKNSSVKKVQEELLDHYADFLGNNREGDKVDPIRSQVQK